MTPLVINVIVIMILCFFIIKCSCFHLCFIENYLNPPLPICIPPMLAIIPLPPTLVVATKRPKKKEKGKKKEKNRMR